MASKFRDRLRDWRNRRIADPGFRRFAARFPLTQPVARRQTRALFDLVAGFVYTQTLAAFVRLRLADFLASGTKTTAEIAAHARLTPGRTAQFLRATAALGLTEARGPESHGLGHLGAALIGNDGVAAMIAHHTLLYDDLRDPVGLMRGRSETKLSRFWSYAGNHKDGSAEPYSALMAASQGFIAEEVLDALPLGRYRRLLDIAGGSGAFAQAVARRYPDIAIRLFDLPPVADLARRHIADAGLADRIAVTGGDLFEDPLPGGMDIVTLVRVLHDHDDSRAMAILRAARTALVPGGHIVVAEPMAGTPGAERAGDAYFGFYLMAMGQGRTRTSAELFDMLADAGFRFVSQVSTATPLIVRVMTARV